MNTRITINKRKLTKISADTLADMAFIFFFSNSFISLIFEKIYSPFGLSVLINGSSVFVVYLPLMLLFMVRKGRKIPLDFFALLISLGCFFALTWLIHPEYTPWFLQESYGVWDYVFFPLEGLYAYLFVRLIEDPKRIFRNMRISGWIMYVYFFIQISFSLRRGYWYGVSADSATVKSSYSVAFGYNVLLYAIVFFYEAMMHKRPSDILASVIGLFMILSYGSRGPVLFIGVFLMLLCFTQLKDSKKKWVILLVVIPLILFFYIFYDFLMLLLIRLLSSINISSRFITKLLEGSVSDDNGRNVIWEASINMIKDNPLGYGAMGSKHIISQYNYAGYPHSVVLEMMIDFGVIFGSIILIFLFSNAFKLLFLKSNSEWRDVFLVFLSSSCALFISLCFWSTTAFWASIALGVNCYFDKKRKRLLRFQ